MVHTCLSPVHFNPCPFPISPTPPAFSESDKERLHFLYEEWAHPYFVSKEEYGRIMEVCAGRCSHLLEPVSQAVTG